MGSEASWIHYISPSYKVKWPSLDFKIKEVHWSKKKWLDNSRNCYGVCLKRRKVKEKGKMQWKKTERNKKNLTIVKKHTMAIAWKQKKCRETRQAFAGRQEIQIKNKILCSCTTGDHLFEFLIGCSMKRRGCCQYVTKTPGSFCDCNELQSFLRLKAHMQAPPWCMTLRQTGQTALLSAEGSHAGTI